MILVDTSVWVGHLRQGNAQLTHLLNMGQVASHPLVIGELACGNLKNRKELITLLRALPSVETAEDEEILAFIENHRLMGKGLGLIDMHLLASAILSGIPLWTFDLVLQNMANHFRIGYKQ